MTLNDLECPLHFKVHFSDGTLDVRTLWLSDSTIRIGVARVGGGGVQAGGPSPLPLCGQLTRCFSAVAELFVIQGGPKLSKLLIIIAITLPTDNKLS